MVPAAFDPDPVVSVEGVGEPAPPALDLVFPAALAVPIVALAST
jgi:hypothetical protein